MIRHLGMAELMDKKGVYASTFAFKFEEHHDLFGQIKVDTNEKSTPVDSLVSYAMQFESMLFEINEEHERLVANV